MTIIAVKVHPDHITIGSDSAFTNGWTVEKRERGKLHQVNDMVIGSAGLAETGSLMRLYMDSQKPRESTEYAITEFMAGFYKWADDRYNHRPSGDEERTNWLIVFGGRAWSVEEMYVREVTTFEAIGSGYQIGLGVLYDGGSVRKAIKAACDITPYCDEPISIIKVPKE